MSDKKILISFFSISGKTAQLSKTLAHVIDGDLYEIKPEKGYAPADLNWKDDNSRSTVEMKDANSRPAIIKTLENIDTYDVIFVGFPIWWGLAPRIIQTFLESYDFSGKTIIPFATSGGSGMGKTDSVLKKSCSDETNWCTGKKFSSDASEDILKAWIDSLSL